MPSRRQTLAAVGAVASLAGCTGSATTGTVTHKQVSVTVSRGDTPVETSVATLGYEPDRNLVHGEYDPAYVDAADGTLSITPTTHRRLDDRFASVAYEVNVVPRMGTPANGRVPRAVFETLALGGEATVVAYMADVGRLDVRNTSPPPADPNVTVSRFDLHERLALE